MPGPNFSHLLNKPTSEIKRPAPLPAGVFPGIIKSFALAESREKKTPYVRWTVGLTGWPDSVENEDRVNAAGKAIPITEKSVTFDHYITDDALWRLSDFLAAAHPGDEENLEALIGKTPGTRVKLDIYQEKDSRTGDEFARVRSMTLDEDA